MSKTKFLYRLYAAYVVVCVSLAGLQAQTITGSISGSVLDHSNASIQGAKVVVTNHETSGAREFSTESDGSFLIPDLVPGSYDLKVTQPGFKTYVRKEIALGSTEKVDLHDIRLEIGDEAAEIEVQSESANIETESSSHSVAVSTSQIENTPIRGRNFQGILKAQPGVVDLNTYDTRGWNNSAIPTINGGLTGQVLLTFDGIAAQDSGTPGLSTYQAPSVDAISEVRLMTTTYSAEYGARNGGQVNVVTKNGTSQFHGTAYYYFRHEEFNANEYFNNITGTQKPKYRYENPGGTIGGPVLIPGIHLNRNRNKLFFFFSWDKLWNRQDTSLNKYTMPSQLERQGDFSQSRYPNGSAISVRDPQTGAPFSGNIVPPSRISAVGLALLNRFPLPNATDPTGQRQYNFTSVLSNTNPREDRLVRIDENITSKDTAFVRYFNDYQSQSGYGAVLGAAGDGWGQFPHNYFIPSSGLAGTWIHTFRANLINELSAGQNRAHQQNKPTDDALYAASALPLTVNGQSLTLPSIFGSSANTRNLLPNVNFGLPSGFTAQSSPTGIPNLPTFGFDDRWPFDGTDNLMTITNNVTWIHRQHTLKAGFYLEHMQRDVSEHATYTTEGTFYFGSDLGSPVDTGNPFSNALTGNFYGYGQDNFRVINYSRYNQVEFFLQDSWRATRRLTLDLGVRFQRIGALYEKDGLVQGVFSGGSYNPQKQGQLLFPYCTVKVAATAACPAANKASINPVTGVVSSYSLQGTFAQGSFDTTPFSGIVTQVSGSAPYFRTPPLQYAPRAGFAWDVFGNGRTALRGGFGIFYGRSYGVDTLGATGGGIGPLATPPNYRSPLIVNSNIASLSNAQLVYTPQTTIGGPLSYPPPATYGWNVELQRDLGRGFVLDASYVGNSAHRQWAQGTIDLNAVAPLTDWTPTANNGKPGTVARFLDPTSANGGAGSFYSTNLIRALASPYSGWGAIQAYTQKGASHYNALQAQLNRKLGKRLQVAANYTWSKTMSYSPQQWVADSLTRSVASGTRTHIGNITFSYKIPGAGAVWRNEFARAALDNWNIEGIVTLYSGSPVALSCTAVSAPIGYWTGTPTGGLPFRCQQNGSPWLPDGATPASAGSTASSTLWYPFNAASFALPPVNSLGIGNAPPMLTWGPGVENVDLSIFKRFNLGSERRTLELRLETFNTLNHFNPSNPNATLNLNFNTGVNSNATFGNINSASTPSRRGVLSVRFRF